MVVARSDNLTYFDEVVGGNYGGHVYCYSSKLTHNELLQGDWTKGPAGTGETGFLHTADNRMDQKTGCLADSWEIPELGTMVFHIREGVRWQDKDPLNGRLLTVDDIVFSIERATSGGHFAYFFPQLCTTLEVTSDEAARTVTCTVPRDQWVNFITLIPDCMSIVAPELTELYGGEADWRNVVGTGPFILNDFVDNSTCTFVRNPDYWETDPIGPGMGNQLPYLDEYVWLVIVDPSTREAAFRSGQTDILGPIDINEAQPILNDLSLIPRLEWVKEFPDMMWGMFMRTDLPESPFSIKEVRQAMMLAIDQPLIRDNYWQGEGVLLTHPITPTKPYIDAYMPLEEMPEFVQKLYTRDLELARELLDQAGYLESGIDCSVICWNTPTMLDILLMYKDMLADINIRMELDIKDYAVYTGITRGGNYGPYELVYTTDAGNGVYMMMCDIRGQGAYNASQINVDYSITEIEETYDAIVEYAGTNEAEMMRIHREFMPWFVEQAYCIPSVAPPYYHLWWLWVKNFYGCWVTGFGNLYGSAKYSWIDQDLKAELKP